MSRVCHEEVSRKGELQPCDKPAVAERTVEDYWYPVCTTHTRGTCRPLGPALTPEQCDKIHSHEFQDICGICGVYAYKWYGR